jgi:hypothetical protein
VVKIVRELDRYHRFVAAEQRLPDASHLEAPAQTSLAFGAAMFRRPENPPQRTEKIESAPGIGFSHGASLIDPSCLNSMRWWNLRKALNGVRGGLLNADERRLTAARFVRTRS